MTDQNENSCFLFSLFKHRDAFQFLVQSIESEKHRISVASYFLKPVTDWLHFFLLYGIHTRVFKNSLVKSTGYTDW